MDDFRVSSKEIVGNNGDMQYGVKAENGFGRINEMNGINGIEPIEKAGLPVKPSMWSRFKSFWLQDVTVELTPRQQAFEDKINEVLNTEVTFKKFHDFMFQEIKFGK